MPILADTLRSSKPELCPEHQNKREILTLKYVHRRNTLGIHLTHESKSGKIGDMKRSGYLACAMMLPLLCVSCGESDQEKRDRAAQFTTPTKAAPNPQRESLQSLIRADKQVPTTLQGKTKFELYSMYEGQDMRQVTEVSGRTLLLCFTAPWCNHSTAMRKALQELAAQEKGGIQVVEIDADAYPAIAEDFNLTKVPTTVFYTEGIRLRSIEGAYTTESLKLYLHNLLTQEETGTPAP